MEQTNIRTVQKTITREFPACLQCGKDASRGSPDKLYCGNHKFKCQQPECEKRSRCEWCRRHSPEYKKWRAKYNHEYYMRNLPSARLPPANVGFVEDL